MKYTYFALFDTDKDDPEAINVTFPDIFGGMTCGYGEGNAFSMAVDLLKSMLDVAPEQCGKPTSFDEMKKLFPNRKIVEISIDV